MATYTQADLDALIRAKKSGVYKVKIGDEETTFRSLSEMNRLEQEIRSDLDQQANPSRRPVRGLRVWSGRRGW
jgi:hypothetical protein